MCDIFDERCFGKRIRVEHAVEDYELVERSETGSHAVDQPRDFDIILKLRSKLLLESYFKLPPGKLVSLI